MNSMPADVDVNAQWHTRDTIGAIKRRVMINNSANCGAPSRGWVLSFVWQTTVCVHYMCTKECGYVFLSSEVYIGI